MKNKIFKKILLVVVCVSMLVVSLVVPSFAYTWVNPNAMNNDSYYFNLPRSSIVLKNNTLNSEGITDLPYNLYLSTAENVCRQTYANASLQYSLPAGYNSNFSLYTYVHQSNVYETASYYFGGEFAYISSYFDVDYANLYFLDHINYGDVWISNQNLINYAGSLYNSLQVSLDCTPFYVLNGQATDRPYVIAYYYMDYIDSNGILNNYTINIPIYLDTFDDGGTRFFATVNYVPADFVGRDVVYIQDVNIYLSADTEISIFYTRDDLEGTTKRAVATFSNRMIPPSNFSEDVYNSMVDGIGDEYYDEGYGDGYRDASQANAKGPFEVIFDGVDSFLSWEFLPGVSFGIILTIMIAVFLVIAFLKFFAGG